MEANNQPASPANGLTEAQRAEILAADRQVLEDAPEVGPAEVQPEEREAGIYLATRSGLFRLKEQKADGSREELPLTNFVAFIRAQVVEDDGAETRRALEMEAHMDGRTYRFTLPSERFNTMSWPIEHLGPGAIVFPGQANRDHAKVGIQQLSRQDGFAARVVYRHTGWREVEGAPVYLHAGGAIGKDGPVSGIDVDLGEKLARYRLPDPPTGDRLRDAIGTSLSIARTVAAPEAVMVLGSVYRAPLGEADLSGCVAGRTGTRKSTVAALGQQHFGPGMDRLRLPENWSSTDNALELAAFLVKDALLVVDEFKPSGPVSEQQKLHSKAGRILQAAGNASGRGRLRADLSQRPDRRPRGLILVTGEDIPQGESTRARMAIVEVRTGHVPIGPGLDALQQAADAGVLAEAMAGYVRWLAGRHADRVKGWRKDFESLRGRFQARHARTPEVMAHLALGWRYWLDFALDSGAVSNDESEQWFAWAVAELAKLAEAQGKLQAEADPVHRFLELLGEAIASGRAHVAGRNGLRPELSQPGDEFLSDDERKALQEESDAHARAWGWRKDDRGDWHPQGHQVGWIDGDLYLQANPSHKAVQEMAGSSGESLAVGPNTLGKRLAEAGKLVTVTSPEEPRVGKTFNGMSRRVLHLKPLELFISSRSTTSALEGEESHNHANSAVADRLFTSATNAEISATPPAGPDPQCQTFGIGCRSSEAIDNGSDLDDKTVSALPLPKLPSSKAYIGLRTSEPLDDDEEVVA